MRIIDPREQHRGRAERMARSERERVDREVVERNHELAQDKRNVRRRELRALRKARKP